ncbi:MAG: hypothetical protein SFX73_04580 [Kofleriaceae bacterium]|nr:hypothetical protein [Kofleriaceae bacterium]
MLTRRYAGLALLLFAACAASTSNRPTSRQWEARGDAAASTDPATAVGNYRNAVTAANPSAELDEKLQRATSAWLERVIAERRPTFGKSGLDDIEFIEAVYEKAKEYDVTLPSAAELATVKAAAERQRWIEFRDTPRATGYERLGLLESARRYWLAMGDLEDEGEAAIASATRALVENTEQRLARATLPGTRFLYARVLGALTKRLYDDGATRRRAAP